MKLGFLFYTHSMDQSLVRTVRSLTKWDHNVYLMINEEKDRQQARYHFSMNHRVHIENELEFANEGDLSLPRFYLHMMKKAVIEDTCDYVIALDKSMVPTISNEALENFFEKHYPTNFYYVSPQPPDSKRINRYYPYTNIKSFSTSKFTQGWSKATAAILNFFHITRKPLPNPQVGSAYFAMSAEGVRDILDYFSFLTDHFMLSWWPHQTGLIMLFEQFCQQPHENIEIAYYHPQPFTPFQALQPIKDEDVPTTLDHLFIGGLSDEKHKQFLKQHYLSDLQ